MPDGATGEVLPLGWLVEFFLVSPRRWSTLLVGMDGRGGSGKTTLAAALSALAPAVRYVSLNAFYIPVERQTTSPPEQRTSVDDTDLPRLFREVIEPIRADHPSRYQVWDREADALTGWRDIEPGGILILEGVGAASNVLRPELDCTLWLDCPRETRFRRGMMRDGEAMRATWERQWLPAGDRYEQAHHPMDHADIVVDSSGTIRHDPLETFVLLRNRQG